MPIKKDRQVENNKNLTASFQEILGLVDVKGIKIIDALEAEERRDFCRWCHQVYNSQHFDLIFKNFVFAQVMLTAEREASFELYNNGKMVINGLSAFKKLLGEHAYIWEQEYAPQQEDFDKHKSFSPQQI